MQEVEQVAAPQPQPERSGMQIGVAKIEHGTAARRARLQATHDRTARDRLLAQPERVEHREAGGLKQKPRTNRAGLRDSFEDRDAVTLPRQQDRRGLAGDAATDDADLHRSHGNGAAQRPPFTTRHWPLT